MRSVTTHRADVATLRSSHAAAQVGVRRRSGRQSCDRCPGAHPRALAASDLFTQSSPITVALETVNQVVAIEFADFSIGEDTTSVLSLPATPPPGAVVTGLEVVVGARAHSLG